MDQIWENVERVHNLIPMDRLGSWNFLTLVCTGHTTGWAASFDFNLDPEWYEQDQITQYPFAARGETAAIAIERAIDRVFRSLPRQIAEPRKGEHLIPAGSREGTCRSCSAAVIWITTPKGSAMPLSVATIEERDGERYALSHFSDCPQAKGWSKKGAGRTS